MIFSTRHEFCPELKVAYLVRTGVPPTNYGLRLLLNAPTILGASDWQSGTSMLYVWELHPAVVHFPIAFLLGGLAIDVVAWLRNSRGLMRVASGLLIAGVVAGIVAAGLGALAYFTVPAHTEEAHSWMLWHLSLAITSLVLFSFVVIARWRRHGLSPTMFSRLMAMAGAGILVWAASLGGHIVYRGGAGVQPNLLVAELRGGHQHGTSDHKDTHGHQEQSASGEKKAQSAEESHAEHQVGSMRKDDSRHEASTREQQQPAYVSYVARMPQGRSPEELPKIPAPDAQAADVPQGYQVEVIETNLNYPTSIEFDDTGTTYIAEAGYVYGDDIAPARILRRRDDGHLDLAAKDLSAPVTDLLWYEGRLYISHRGKISVLESDGAHDLVTGLPSLGDHHNNQMAIGPDGKLYIGQGVATNSGVVGLDNFKMGWLSKYPDVHDIPAKDIHVSNQAFASADPISMLAAAENYEESDRPERNESSMADHAEHQSHKQQKATGAEEDRGTETPEAEGQEQPEDEGHGRHTNEEKQEQKPEMQHSGSRLVRTFGFQPFGKTPPDNGAIRGEIKSNGTILRMNLDGSDLEVYAWGLRNPNGLMWGPDGQLYASDNGYDERGSRLIAHAPDCFWRIKQDAWYGFPDYAAGMPVTDDRFRPDNGPAPEFLLLDHPPAEKPMAILKPHAGAAKIDISTSAKFGFEGQVFLALVGDMNPITGAHDERSGFEIVRIDPDSGKVHTFFKAKKNALGPEGMEYVTTAGPRRPIDVRFSPDGSALYVVDLGPVSVIATASGYAPHPFPAEGVIWRITRN